MLRDKEGNEIFDLGLLEPGFTVNGQQVLRVMYSLGKLEIEYGEAPEGRIDLSDWQRIRVLRGALAARSMQISEMEKIIDAYVELYGVISGE